MKRIMSIIGLLLIFSIGSFSQVIRSMPTDVRWGGRTVSVTVHPVTTTEVIAASATGGLFKSTDGGTSWRHIDNLPVTSMMDVKYNPIFNNKVIATCNIDTDTSHRIGIWLSADRGETWSQLSVLPSPPTRERSRFPKRYSAYGISFDMNGVAFVGTDYGIAIGKAAHNRWEHVKHDNTIAAASDKMQNAVYSVQAFGSGKLIIGAKSGVYYCNDMYLLAPFRKSMGISSFEFGGIHGIAQSPYNEKDVFITPDLETLMYSSDTGRTFRIHPMPWPGGRTSRTPLVMITRSAERDKIDVYVHKVALTRKRYHKDRLSSDTSGAWDRMDVAHDDISHAAIVDNNLLYVVGDGGVFKKSGDRWNCVGMGRGGYNALQVYQAWGQQVARTGAAARTDYYFGTQDNNLWSSSDGGATWPHDGGIEGGGFDGPRRITDPAMYSVVTVNNSSGLNQFSRANYAGMSEWRDPGQPRGNPKYAGNNTYLQFFIDTNTNDIKIMSTLNTGRSWNEVGRISGYGLWQGERVSTDSSYTMYIPYSRPLPFENGLANIGLLRLQRKIHRDGSFSTHYLRNMDTVRSLGSLMVYPADFAWPTVYGFDHNDAYRLLAPDVESKTMKWSSDGGVTWRADNILTNLITENGRYAFYESPVVFSVWTISFNPANSRQIAIGTKDAGIVYTSDGGMNWCRIPGSKQIPNITSIWWDFDGSALVSSYGRGLWRFNASAYRSSSGECVSTLPRLNIDIRDIVLRPEFDLRRIDPPRTLANKIETTKPVFKPLLNLAISRPVARLITTTTRGGEMVVGDNGRITITGSGFSPSTNASLEMNDKMIVKSLIVSADGSIRHTMVLKQQPGIYRMDIVQYINGKKIETAVIVKIPFHD
jgi:hypothetical protein